MAFAGAYEKFTVTNLDSSETDYTLLVDLCDRMGASWWSEVDTADGTKGRAAKDDGVTELACDWIEFDNSGETGLLRVKWSGVLSSVGTNIIRIYPPLAANSSYAASDPYGSDNAYDSIKFGSWPMHDVNDRTSNGRNLIGYGGITIGGVAGLVGECTDFDGSSDYIDCETNFDWSSDWTFMCLVRFDTGTTDQALLANPDSNSPLLWRDEFASGDRLGMFITGETTGYDSNTLGTITWYHAAVACDSGGVSPIYLDGATAASGGDVSGASAAAFLRLGGWNGGAPGRLLNGQMQHVSLATAQRSAGWIKGEADMLLDQASFWGSGTWVPAAGGLSIPVAINNYRQQGVA